MRKSKMSGLLIAALFLITLGGIGAILLAVDQFKGTEALKQNIIDSNDSIISNLKKENVTLKDTIESKNKLLQLKQSQLEKLQLRQLGFSEDIKNITSNTKLISTIIKNEQREKGGFKLSVKEYNAYEVLFGTGLVSHLIYKEQTEPMTNSTFGLETTLSIVDDLLLISLQLRDKEDRIMVDIKDSNWAVNKDLIFSLNHDNKGIEIINNSGVVCFQLEIIDNIIFISGINFNKKGVTFFAPNLLRTVEYNNPNFEKEVDNLWGLIDTKFIHNGENYLGKRIK